MQGASIHRKHALTLRVRNVKNHEFSLIKSILVTKRCRFKEAEGYWRTVECAKEAAIQFQENDPNI